MASTNPILKGPRPAPTAKAKANARARRDARRAEVASLVLQEIEQQEIARKLGVNPGTISRDVTVLREAWRATAVERTAEERSIELAKLQRDEQMLRRKMSRCADPVKTALVYDRVAKVMERRSKILGLDMPTRVQVEAHVAHDSRVSLVDMAAMRALSPERREAAIESARRAITLVIEASDDS